MRKYKFIENNITYDIKEYDNGDKEWCLNGLCHRENGPAIEYFDGSKFWYVNYHTLKDVASWINLMNLV